MYAFDAGSNGGSDAKPLWKSSLLAGTGSKPTVYTILGTPVIDPTTNTMYVAAMTSDSGTWTARLHALDITTGLEKFGGPTLIQGSVAGTGSGSVGGVLTFNAGLEIQRAGLLLQNGVVYVPFASINDNGAWHGWIFSYSAATMQPISIFCTTPNGTGGGIWQGGAGLAAEVNNPNQPFGRMFVSTGNGTIATAPPYTNSQSYAMSLIDLDLTGGVMTVEDEFTPFNAASLDAQDGDLGSGGAVLLPSQVLASGTTLNPLVHVGKYGTITILNRNQLGGYNTTADQVVQEVKTPSSGYSSWGSGIWGSPAYWNNKIYFGGVPSGGTNSVTAYSFVKGVLSSAPTSQTAEQFAYPGPTPSISANGTHSGIVWVLKNDAYTISGPALLLAYDATNLANLLYASNANSARDTPGPAIRFNVPTVANGRVYVGTANQLSVYGILGNLPTVASPIFTPSSTGFVGSQVVSISDASPGAKIYYTTDGSTPSISSNLYTGPFTITSSKIITAVANAPGYLQGPSSTATYTSSVTTMDPSLSLAAGEYSGPQMLTITDSSPGAVIYYTVDGSTPTTSSNIYAQPLNIPVPETVQTLAVAPGLSPSFVVTAVYTIDPLYTFAYPNGFVGSESTIQFNGSTTLDDFRLQLTNGGLNEQSSAFYNTPVNIQAFTTDFVFQLSNPQGDGLTFTIQNSGPNAVGGNGDALGYATIPNSVAVKFDLVNDQGEGPDSTGIYLNGAMPTVPAIDLTNTGINLHSGDYMQAHITYDGAALNLSITDQITGAKWSHSFAVNIPAAVGANTAYVGFTASSDSVSASQKVTYWTYLGSQLTVPNYPAGFDNGNLVMNGNAALTGSTLHLTNGGASQLSSAYFSQAVPIAKFTTDFDFQFTGATADGFTFVLQNAGTTAIGAGGGGLGYSGIPQSAAIKFDIYNNAGEGSDSTGFYQNGAPPTIPSIDLTPSSLGLNLGHLDHAHIVYDGSVLTWTITDPLGHRFNTNSKTVSLSEILGGYTAYVGFTAASGDGTAIQNIVDWTYTSP
ncbi:chitobiase/beta-hexosaminidase C-terminal domain-containing protein [Acidisarcina polymorpha]|nr:chitobiase/beta-hexosaminidase C-terminal domain-containing protein [Acidisarcina polymorpha]